MKCGTLWGAESRRQADYDYHFLGYWDFVFSLPAITKRFAEQDKEGDGRFNQHVIFYSSGDVASRSWYGGIPTEVYQLFYANGVIEIAR